ncbi:2,3-dimethylmalate lyase [Bordetella tumbae]|uniref:isocitrate lyase/PEP mutase family protein n=1 Tax=Bordetella tumbae TaxID=1649139 RepID=UPI0039F14AE1
MKKTTTTLREQLTSESLIVAPGAYDAIGARMIEQAGFDAVYMTGAGTSAARGYPDFGLLTLDEMVNNAASMARAIAIPLIADADTGYGNDLNVTRTTREFEACGVTAIQLEDQVSPKRCGHLDGKSIVPRQEFIAKIRAAVRARRSAELALIARTDARAVEGMDEAIWRANAALDAGADVAFVEAAQTLDEVREIPRRVKGPCLLNLVQNGRTPILPMHQVQEMGYRIAIAPGLLLTTMLAAGDAALARLRIDGKLPPSTEDVTSVFRRFGAEEWNALRRELATERNS